MPPLSAAQHHVSVDEYLSGECLSEVRHEYVDGQVYAMVGASDRHGLIVDALAFALTPAARHKRCQLFTSDMKVKLDFSGQQVFYYPDLLLSCDSEDKEPYFRSSPCLIVEVLSESTERIDRREKLLAYQTLPSWQAYVLVAQHTRRVEAYRRATAWQPECHETGSFRVDCLDVDLALDDIYVDVLGMEGWLGV